MRSCCVVNCTNRSENGWRMFNIPRGRHPFPQNRRRLWLQVIRRVDWCSSGPTTAMSICGAHFISGEPSMDCDSPDFVPSIFPQRAIYDRKRKDKASATTSTVHADAEPESGGLTLMAKQRPKPQKRPFKNKVITNSKVQENNGGKTVSKKARIQSRTSIQNKCCVINCPSKSHNDRGQRTRNNLTFYSFPTWTQNCGVFVSHLSKRRRQAWVTAVGRPDVTFDVSEEVKVCSRHFVTGKPALGMVEVDLDWVPTLHLHKNEAEIVQSPGKKRKPMKKRKNIVKKPVKRKRKEAVKDTSGPVPLEWKSLKSCLQGLMTDTNEAKEVTPAVDNSALPFEEYFRNALTASLDSCQSSQQKPPSCENCIRLEERISELEERLATPHQILGQNIWPQWTEPLSQPTVEQSPPRTRDKKIPSQTNTFMVNLIKRHWFLRFSPNLNTIWCHVCRLYAEKGPRHSKFVTGTRSFQNNAIALHTKTVGHKECVKKFMALKSAKKTAIGRFRR